MDSADLKKRSGVDARLLDLRDSDAVL